MGEEKWMFKVDWPVSGNGDWINTDDEFRKKTAITRYCVEEANGFVYKYTIWIETDERDKQYHFFDGEGDIYSLSARFPGKHSVNYNSKDARIEGIDAWDQKPMSDYDYSA